MTDLDSVLKRRDITLPTKVYLVKDMVFPEVMYGCESWTIKQAECQTIHAFELWCWRILRVPWTARRYNQSILTEISLNIHWKDWCWSSNTLVTWWEELSQWKRPWCWQRMKTGGEGDNRGWDGCIASPSLWTWVWVSSVSWWWTGRPGVLQSMGRKESGRTERLNWKVQIYSNIQYHVSSKEYSNGNAYFWKNNCTLLHLAPKCSLFILFKVKINL